MELNLPALLVLAFSMRVQHSRHGGDFTDSMTTISNIKEKKQPC